MLFPSRVTSFDGWSSWFSPATQNFKKLPLLTFRIVNHSNNTICSTLHIRITAGGQFHKKLSTHPVSTYFFRSSGSPILPKHKIKQKYISTFLMQETQEISGLASVSFKEGPKNEAIIQPLRMESNQPIWQSFATQQLYNIRQPLLDFARTGSHYSSNKKAFPTCKVNVFRSTGIV